MISIKKLCKEYGDTRVVNDVSFCVSKGEIFGFLGPNGAGKTTTIRMAIGLLRPTSGTIEIDGINVWKERRKVHQMIGVVFELPNLYKNASIKKNLEIFAAIYSVKKERIAEIMEDLQLTDKKNIKVSKLSKGWKQRVLIARAVLHSPKVLFLDEPTSGLDPNTTALIRKYVQKIHNEGTTIIITTHDMHEADMLCDRIGIMYKGKLEELGTPEELKAKYSKRQIRVIYEENNEIVTKIFDDNEQSQGEIEELMRNRRVTELKRIGNGLDNVFSNITGGELN